MYVVFQDLLTQETIGKEDLRGRLFHLDCMYVGEKPTPTDRHALTLSSDRLNELWLWHRRLGHPAFSVMKKLMPSLFLGIKESSLHCETCVLAKSHRVSYPSSLHNKSTMPFELIHSDVWGPSQVPTLFGMRWFVPFIDDCTRLTWVVLLKHKSAVFSAFLAFHALIQTQYNGHIKVFRLIMMVNLLIMISLTFFTLRVLFTKPLVLRHLSRMVCLKVRIVTSWIWPVLYY